MSALTSNPATTATGLVVMLDAAGRTILELEHRVEYLTAQVGQLAEERDSLRRLLDEARATTGVPPTHGDGPENGSHAAPPDPAQQ